MSFRITKYENGQRLAIHNSLRKQRRQKLLQKLRNENELKELGFSDECVIRKGINMVLSNDLTGIDFIYQILYDKEVKIDQSLVNSMIQCFVPLFQQNSNKLIMVLKILHQTSLGITYQSVEILKQTGIVSFLISIIINQLSSINITFFIESSHILALLFQAQIQLRNELLTEEFINKFLSVAQELINCEDVQVFKAIGSFLASYTHQLPFQCESISIKIYEIAHELLQRSFGDVMAIMLIVMKHTSESFQRIIKTALDNGIMQQLVSIILYDSDKCKERVLKMVLVWCKKCDSLWLSMNSFVLAIFSYLKEASNDILIEMIYFLKELFLFEQYLPSYLKLLKENIDALQFLIASIRSKYLKIQELSLEFVHQICLLNDCQLMELAIDNGMVENVVDSLTNEWIKNDGRMVSIVLESVLNSFKCSLERHKGISEGIENRNGWMNIGMVDGKSQKTKEIVEKIKGMIEEERRGEEMEMCEI
ncbi:hypothetical protein, conserved [Entamoeba histolytica]